MEDQRERHERVTFVFGIVVAAVIGFGLNVYANIYYEVFMLGTKSMDSYNELATMLPGVVLVYSFGLLSFLVYDYKNRIALDQPFLQRLFDYYENIFWPTKFASRMSRFFIFVFKWAFAILIGLALFQSSSILALSIWIEMILLWQIGKYLYRSPVGTLIRLKILNFIN